MNEKFIKKDDCDMVNEAIRKDTVVNVETDYQQSAFGGEMLRAIHEFLETHSTITPLHIILN